MKSFFLFVFYLFLFNSCSSQINDDLSIKYEARTRGSSILVVVNSTEIIYSDNSETKKNELSENQWKEIKVLVSKIELNTIKKLITPSNKSYTDRALIASMSITKNKVKYKSSNFDHGNPPSELIDLINKLFEIVNSD